MGAPLGTALAASHGAPQGQGEGDGEQQCPVEFQGRTWIHLPAQVCPQVGTQRMGFQEAQPREQVVAVGHSASKAVVADTGVIQAEKGCTEAQREAAEKMCSTTHAKGQQHPRGVAPKGQQQGVVEGKVSAAPQQEEPPKSPGKQQQWDEMGPEIEGLVGGLQH